MWIDVSSKAEITDLLAKQWRVVPLFQRQEGVMKCPGPSRLAKLRASIFLHGENRVPGVCKLSRDPALAGFPKARGFAGTILPLYPLVCSPRGAVLVERVLRLSEPCQRAT